MATVAYSVQSSVPPSHPQVYTVEEVIHPRVFDCAVCGEGFYIRDAIVQRDGSLQCRECSTTDRRGYRWCPECRQAKPPAEFFRDNWAQCSDCWDARLHPAPIVNVCERCGAEFTPARRDARFCSGRCRVAAHRALS